MVSKTLRDAAERGILELDGGVMPHRALRNFLRALASEPVAPEAAPPAAQDPPQAQPVPPESRVPPPFSFRPGGPTFDPAAPAPTQPKTRTAKGGRQR